MSKVIIFGASSELGLEVCVRLLGRQHDVIGVGRRGQSVQKIEGCGATAVQMATDDFEAVRGLFETQSPDVVINLSHQLANTLLHDGHNWQNVSRSLPNNTDVLLDAAQVTTVGFFIHTSFAFLYHGLSEADENTAVSLHPSNKIIQAAIEAENLVMQNGVVPYSILRLGYLYGPQLNDLALYELSFKMKRPYYAGPKTHRATHVHLSDAAEAIVLAAEKQKAGELFNIVDGETAVSFTDFINQYAKALGRKNPRHIPIPLVRFAPLLIAPQQVKQLELISPNLNYTKANKQLSWAPQFASYKEGLKQTVRHIRQKG